MNNYNELKHKSSFKSGELDLRLIELCISIDSFFEVSSKSHLSKIQGDDALFLTDFEIEYIVKIGILFKNNNMSDIIDKYEDKRSYVFSLRTLEDEKRRSGSPIFILLPSNKTNFYSKGNYFNNDQSAKFLEDYNSSEQAKELIQIINKKAAIEARAKYFLLMEERNAGQFNL